jgi:hypothetical protein
LSLLRRKKPGRQKDRRSEHQRFAPSAGRNLDFTKQRGYSVVKRL